MAVAVAVAVPVPVAAAESKASPQFAYRVTTIAGCGEFGAEDGSAAAVKLALPTTIAQSTFDGSLRFIACGDIYCLSRTTGMFDSAPTVTAIGARVFSKRFISFVAVCSESKIAIERRNRSSSIAKEWRIGWFTGSTACLYHH